MIISADAIHSRLRRLSAGRVTQLEENLKAVEAQGLFTPEVMARVDEVLAGAKLSTWS